MLYELLLFKFFYFLFRQFRPKFNSETNAIEEINKHTGIFFKNNGVFRYRKRGGG